MVGRTFALGFLAVVGVVATGVWLGHRLDPTWGRRNAPLRRQVPFAVPRFAAAAGGTPVSAADFAGRPWILELRFPGCGADDADLSPRVRELGARVRTDTGGQLGWLTLLTGGLPGDATPADPFRRVAPLDPRALGQLAADLGIADGAAGDGLLDARHWLFAVDAAGWVRAAADISNGAGWGSFADRAAAAAASPLPAPARPVAEAVPFPDARLIAFQAIDQDGRAVTAQTFAGHPLVIDFIFTRCTGPCPMLTARLSALRRIVSDPDVRFLSFSVDPAHDTPEVLRAYAARWGTPDPRWRLLSADAATVRAVARGLGELVVQRPDGPLLHSDHFTLVDGAGAVRARVLSTAVQALAAQLGAPAASASHPAQDGEAAAGARLFASLGCAGCHGHAALAPSLGGVAGRPVRLADGRTVAADDRYLRESITSPLAAVVDGFGPAMPSYGALLSDTELGALVSYLKSLPN